MTTTERQPVIFVSHGGGPCFWVEFPEPIGAHAFDGLRLYLAGLLDTLPARPRAIVVISAHWETETQTINTNPAPPMLFDYGGFPEETYRLSYPAPGDPTLAARMGELLKQAGIATVANAERGFDHGVFVPMLIVDPKAEIPVVVMSLRHDLDPAHHLAVGKALAPLRDEGVLIIGSGNSFHNLRSFLDGEAEASRRFDDWLTDVVTRKSPQMRNSDLTNWTEAPFARVCHPKEEHLIPLMVVAGAAGDDAGRRVFHDLMGTKTISGFEFG